MRQNPRPFLVLLTMLLLFVFSSVAPGVPPTHSSRPVQSSWEYCALVEAYGTNTDRPEIAQGKATIVFFQTEGPKTEVVTFEMSYLEYVEKRKMKAEKTIPNWFYELVGQRALSKALEKLGKDGWEMVMEGNMWRKSTFVEVREIYFKRQIARP